MLLADTHHNPLVALGTPRTHLTLHTTQHIHIAHSNLLPTAPITHTDLPPEPHRGSNASLKWADLPCTPDPHSPHLGCVAQAGVESERHLLLHWEANPQTQGQHRLRLQLR